MPLVSYSLCQHYHIYLYTLHYTHVLSHNHTPLHTRTTTQHYTHTQSPPTPYTSEMSKTKQVAWARQAQIKGFWTSVLPLSVYCLRGTVIKKQFIPFPTNTLDNYLSFYSTKVATRHRLLTTTGTTLTEKESIQGNWEVSYFLKWVLFKRASFFAGYRLCNIEIISGVSEQNRGSEW